MAGLPCDTCQEESIVIPSGVILQDEGGATAYRRYRVCINPKCERYCQRRETLEQYLPETGERVMLDTRQLREYLPQAPPDANRSPGLFDSFWDTKEG
ncbi:hypothetical protein [Deinococcus humi]|uniref:Uncharacterized protein n=1 Tax=Deinococcus humi TaxID=662880 RepID=A0A7W8NE79_9DEIO|nr:hypothetical protein [Deinococcus humi]MBB5363076.1 hypothetical protein [Deinococcus humi]GGO24844.1 hypothetical protein GCM10008949_14100 [Deinococcus humi]